MLGTGEFCETVGQLCSWDPEALLLALCLLLRGVGGGEFRLVSYPLPNNPLRSRYSCPGCWLQPSSLHSPFSP